ncbi:hypothetical protein HYV81_02850 [Candidatus Woesearchaeota archaeon]|nr:hypothetical protein [Candidatus Woesearchaeota archaeon]
MTLAHKYKVLVIAGTALAVTAYSSAYGQQMGMHQYPLQLNPASVYSEEAKAPERVPTREILDGVETLEEKLERPSISVPSPVEGEVVLHSGGAHPKS